jgi:hypothetical protein
MHTDAVPYRGSDSNMHALRFIYYQRR